MHAPTLQYVSHDLIPLRDDSVFGKARSNLSQSSLDNRIMWWQKKCQSSGLLAANYTFSPIIHVRIIAPMNSAWRGSPSVKRVRMECGISSGRSSNIELSTCPHFINPTDTFRDIFWLQGIEPIMIFNCKKLPKS